MRLGAAFVSWLALVAAASVTPALPTTLISLDEALASAFPPPLVVEARTAFLDEEDARKIEKIAGSEPRSRIIRYFVAHEEGATDAMSAGAGFLDTHLVRTLEETLLIVVTPAGTIGRIEVLSFREPREYLPSARWIAQFEGRKLDEDLWLRRGVRPLSGATLSSRSITEAARRALALHALLVSGQVRE
jgi:hypothetical protein